MAGESATARNNASTLSSLSRDIALRTCAISHDLFHLAILADDTALALTDAPHSDVGLEIDSREIVI